MRNRCKAIVIAVLLSVLTVTAVTPAVGHAGDAPPDASLDALRDQVRVLEEKVASLEEQNQGIANMVQSLNSNDIYIVVDTENNRLTLRRGDHVLLTAVVGTGSRQYVEEETGRHWWFESPLGSLSVLGKERNPVWIRPDWSYVEENMPVPAPDDPDRIVRDVLGKYALVLGCISVGDKDLEKLYRTVKIGTKVYIY
jgi:lipoprotein-anchoring transpeptidase ErfK/SrfK